MPPLLRSQPYVMPVAMLLCRFRAAKSREIIASVLHSRLGGAAYNAEKMSVLSREIADEIKQRIKGVVCTTCVLHRAPLTPAAHASWRRC